MRRGSRTINFAPSRSRFFMRDAKHGMPIGRIGADDHDDIGFIDRIEILGSR